jgi:hypothetical protein
MDIKGGSKKTTTELITLIKGAPVSIYPSMIGKLKLFLAMAFLMILGAFFSWLGLKNSEPITLIVGILFLVFGITCGVLIFVKFSQNKPTIQISKDGIVDHHNLKGKLIHWNEITQASVYKQSYNTFLGLYLSNIDKKQPHQNKLSNAWNNLGRDLGLPDLIYPQTILGGLKAATLAETIEHLRTQYNNPFEVKE